MLLHAERYLVCSHRGIRQGRNFFRCRCIPGKDIPSAEPAQGKRDVRPSRRAGPVAKGVIAVAVTFYFPQFCYAAIRELSFGELLQTVVQWMLHTPLATLGFVAVAYVVIPKITKALWRAILFPLVCLVIILLVIEHPSTLAYMATGVFSFVQTHPVASSVLMLIALCLLLTPYILPLLLTAGLCLLAVNPPQSLLPKPPSLPSFPSFMVPAPALKVEENVRSYQRWYDNRPLEEQNPSTASGAAELAPRPQPLALERKTNSNPPPQTPATHTAPPELPFWTRFGMGTPSIDPKPTPTPEAKIKPAVVIEAPEQKAAVGGDGKQGGDGEVPIWVKMWRASGAAGSQNAIGTAALEARLAAGPRTQDEVVVAELDAAFHVPTLVPPSAKVLEPPRAALTSFSASTPPQSSSLAEPQPAQVEATGDTAGVLRQLREGAARSSQRLTEVSTSARQALGAAGSMVEGVNASPVTEALARASSTAKQALGATAKTVSEVDVTSAMTSLKGASESAAQRLDAASKRLSNVDWAAAADAVGGASTSARQALDATGKRISSLDLTPAKEMLSGISASAKDVIAGGRVPDVDVSSMSESLARASSSAKRAIDAAGKKVASVDLSPAAESLAAVTSSAKGALDTAGKRLAGVELPPGARESAAEMSSSAKRALGAAGEAVSNVDLKPARELAASAASTAKGVFDAAEKQIGDSGLSSAASSASSIAKRSVGAAGKWVSDVDVTAARSALADAASSAKQGLDQAGTAIAKATVRARAPE